MKIIKVKISGNNPSLGPHDKHSVKTTDLTKMQDLADSLLNDTLINGTINLKNYIALKKENKLDEITKVHQAYSPGVLAKGARILNLHIYLDDGTSITFSDLRKFKFDGNGYTDFKNYHDEHGIVSTNSELIP